MRHFVILQKVAKVIGRPMSTYYQDPKVSRAEAEERDADVRSKIEQVRVEFPRLRVWQRQPTAH